MIKAIVFDLGNVLMEFGWERFFHERGYEGEAFEKIADATVRSPWWLELDKGTVTKEEAVAHYIENAPEYEEEFLGLYDRIDQMLVRYDYALDWIQELRERGYKLYALSNWSAPALEGCAEGLSFLDDLDGVVLSYQEKVIKPNAQIYKILRKRAVCNLTRVISDRISGTADSHTHRLQGRGNIFHFFNLFSDSISR